MISSLSILHSPEHTKRFTELSREEKGREEIEVSGEESKGERVIKPVITPLSENVYRRLDS